MAYLNAIREFAIVLVLQIKEFDGIRVLLGQLPALQTLLYCGQSVERTGQVARESQDDDSLHPLVVDDGGHLVLEEGHQEVLLVIYFVVGIISVDSSGHTFAVQPRSILCEWAN